MTVSILLDMDSTNSWQVDGGMLYRAAFNCCHSFCLVREPGVGSLDLTICHRFSIGFRSGDCAVQFMTSILWSTNHFLTAFAERFRSLSCINCHFNDISHSAWGSMTVWIMFKYLCCLMISFIQKIGPTPYLEKHPQTMMLPPPCFTVFTVYCGRKEVFNVRRTQRFWIRT